MYDRPLSLNIPNRRPNCLIHLPQPEMVQLISAVIAIGGVVEVVVEAKTHTPGTVVEAAPPPHNRTYRNPRHGTTPTRGQHPIPLADSTISYGPHMSILGSRPAYRLPQTPMPHGHFTMDSGFPHGSLMTPTKLKSVFSTMQLQQPSDT